MIKAVLIDDEANALEMLEWQLQHYCPLVQVVAQCKTADDGVAAIKAHLPRLVFLDIEMPRKNGFEVLLHFPDPFFDVIFTTAYNQFAIKAFKFAALDYLLKPIDAEELIAAVNRFTQKHQEKEFKNKLEVLIQQYHQPPSAVKVPFATQEGIVFVVPANIVHCESSSNYTSIFFTDKTKLVVSKTLKEVEELLHPFGFFRIHHSHLINLQHVSRFLKLDGGLIEMSCGVQLPVARQRKELVLEVLLKRL